MTQILLAIYNLAWLIALPLLKRSARISHGWNQRTLKEAPTGTFDLWIQSASGGESLLTNMVLADLAAHLPRDTSYRVLATSGTRQGIEILLKGCAEREGQPSLKTVVTYFPFDAPALMRKAFARYSPKLAVIVETELWPGFLHQAHAQNTPVLLINGRMSEKSFRNYIYCRRFFATYGPNTIWAISQEDGDRFSKIMGSHTINLMNNIKFDRIQPINDAEQHTSISALLPANIPFVLFGSIHKDEEEQIATTIVRLLNTRNDILIGIFPKHIERADSWLNTLQAKGIRADKRSAATGPCRPGSVIVWDVFGELAGAYELAKTTFIGGSLVKLGGQNFLEPLAFGLKPIIGPYCDDFAWVSQELIDAGLVYEVRNEQELCSKLLSELATEESRDLVVEQVQRFLLPRRGGTSLATREILNYLNTRERPTA